MEQQPFRGSSAPTKLTLHSQMLRERHPSAQWTSGAATRRLFMRTGLRRLNLSPRGCTPISLSPTFSPDALTRRRGVSSAHSPSMLRILFRRPSEPSFSILPPMDAHHPRLQPSCRTTGVRTVPPNEPGIALTD